MTDTGIEIALSLGGGVCLGLIFFGGLRLTTRLIVTARRPVLVTLASFAVRTVVTAAGFVVIGQQTWQRYAAALAGFVLLRFMAVRLWGPTATPAAGPNTSETTGDVERADL